MQGIPEDNKKLQAILDLLNYSKSKKCYDNYDYIEGYESGVLDVLEELGVLKQITYDEIYERWIVI